MTGEATSVLVAILSTGAVSALVLAWFNRRKTSSETQNIDANSARTMTETAGELVQLVKATYEDRLARLEAQIIATDARAAAALVDAARARAAEEGCRERVAALEGEVAGLKAQVAAFTLTTTKTTVTTVSPTPPPMEVAE